MQELSEYTKRHWDVVVIGGGATGAGTLRDLAMRGVKALLLEQRDLVHGTSSRFHGLLHSGARYAVKDAEAGRECIEENRILRRIGKHCVEETEGFFVRTPEDGAEFEATWVTACDKCGIEATPLTVKEARALEPNLADNIVSVYQTPPWTASASSGRTSRTPSGMARASVPIRKSLPSTAPTDKSRA